MAAMVAAGVGCTVLGVLTVLTEASAAVKTALNVYNPVGPLSGKTLGAVLAYVVTWIGLALWARGRVVRIEHWIPISLGLIAIGLILTFPPVYQAFTVK